MAKKKVYVSLDYKHDKYYKYLLESWDANPGFKFMFGDQPPDDIYPNNVDRIKASLTKIINRTSYTLVIIGVEANTAHQDEELIGFKNWMNFEVHQSKLHRNKFVGVKLKESYDSPDELRDTDAKLALRFNLDDITNLLREA